MLTLSAESSPERRSNRSRNAPRTCPPARSCRPQRVARAGHCGARKALLLTSADVALTVGGAWGTETLRVSLPPTPKASAVSGTSAMLKSAQKDKLQKGWRLRKDAGGKQSKSETRSPIWDLPHRDWGKGRRLQGPSPVCSAPGSVSASPPHSHHMGQLASLSARSGSQGHGRFPAVRAAHRPPELGISPLGTAKKC